MTSPLELHILSRLDDISAGVARLETSFADHLTSHKEHEQALQFHAEIRRGRLRWLVMAILAAPAAIVAIVRFL